MDEDKDSEINPIRKTVTFTLEQKEMLISGFLSLGFDRRHVTLLFEKLHSLGFGEFVKGKPGRGSAAKFIPNKRCPDVYILEIGQKKRGRKAAK